MSEIILFLILGLRYFVEGAGKRVTSCKSGSNLVCIETKPKQRPRSHSPSDIISRCLRKGRQ